MGPNYVQPHLNYFWKWEDDNVIAIPDGNTISYAKLIEEYLEPMLPNGFPPFGSLLLALVATNTNENLIHLQQIINTLKLPPDIEVSCTEAFSFLHKLSGLPAWCKDRDAKILLLQTIFKNSHHIGSKKQAELDLKALKNFSVRNLEPPVPVPMNQIIRDFSPLAILNSKFLTSDSISEALLSIRAVSKEIILDSPLGHKPKEFVDELLANSQTERVGALIKALWAGMSLPFHSHSTMIQANGGAADIANKGNFDRLLISEFAYDDVTFLSRLANNEALYLNQESPPEANNAKRTLLIDASIKNWGTPKTLAFSIAVAITKHPKTDIVCETFVVGESYQCIDVDSVSSLIKALSIVEPSISASKGLSRFFNENKVTGNHEVFLITERSTDEDHEMQRLRIENTETIDYWIRTDVNGVIDVFKKQRKSLKHKQRFELPLKNLWARPVLSPDRQLEVSGTVPILFRQTQNHRGVRETSFGDRYMIDKDRAVFRFHSKGGKSNELGWEMILAQTPINSTYFEVGVSKNGVTYLFLFKEHTRQFCIVNLVTNEVANGQFDHWKRVAGCEFVFSDEGFFHVNNSGMWKIEFDGNVHQPQHVFSDLSELIKMRTSEIATTNDATRVGDSVLKNLEMVVVNEFGNLQLNKHQLSVSSGNHIKFSLMPTVDYQVEAVQNGPNSFVFPDGSAVHLIRSGMVVLKSSDSKIPPIFIPTALSSIIGIATYESFAGSNYHFRKPLFWVSVTSYGESILKAVSVLRAHSGLSLKSIKELLEAAPMVVPHYFEFNAAKECVSQLIEHGAMAKMEPTEPRLTELRHIGSTEFLDQYINPFIANIVSHGSET